MKNSWKKAVSAVLAVTVLSVSAASAGLTAFAAHQPPVVNDPESGWTYQVMYNNDKPSYVALIGYTGNSEYLTVPATFTIPGTSTTLPVKSLWGCLLGSSSDRYGIKKVTFEAMNVNPSNTDSSIPFQACQCSKDLKEVNIAVPAKKIGYSAFSNCTALEKVQLPVGLEIIESYVFNHCTSLETITLPCTLKEIGPYAFQNCTALDNVIIPNSVTKIHDNAFKDTKLTRVVVNNRNTDISNTAFPGNVKQFCCPPPPEGTDLKDDKLYQYAQAHGFTYIPFSLGDLNHSGDVDQRDVRKVLEEYTTVSVLHMDSILTETERIEADINSNGKIDARDSLLILNYYTDKFVSKTLDENIFLPDYLLTQK